MTAETSGILAPAKVNLTLSVLGRRSDGYHLLDSLVAFADIGDRLWVTPATDLGLDITGPEADALRATAPSENLVLRAAALLRSAAGVTAGAALHLEKNLPVASGIGGGSADAAAALRLLSAHWGVDLPVERLAALALDLGADVPVCLHGHAAWMSGVGEVLEPAPPLPRDPAPGILLVNPGVATPTGEVFRALDGRFSEARARPARLGPDLAGLIDAISPIGNDLRAAATSVTPAIADLLAALSGLEGCAYAALSGSGATCFGLFEDRATAELAAEGLRHAAPSAWWIAPATLQG